MKVRRLIGVLGASVALVAPGLVMATTAGASPGGSVARYQMETLTFTVVLDGAFIHNFTATLNPCNGSFSGTGVNTSDHRKFETITGEYAGGMLSYTATQYSGPTPEYEVQGPWGTVSPVTISSGSGSGTVWVFSATNTGSILVSSLTVSESTSYASHGAFVSQNPGADSAMSCIGMPMQSMA